MAILMWTQIRRENQRIDKRGSLADDVGKGEGRAAS